MSTPLTAPITRRRDKRTANFIRIPTSSRCFLFFLLLLQLLQLHSILPCYFSWYRCAAIAAVKHHRELLRICSLQAIQFSKKNHLARCFDASLRKCFLCAFTIRRSQALQAFVSFLFQFSPLIYYYQDILSFSLLSWCSS